MYITQVLQFETLG